MVGNKTIPLLIVGMLLTGISNSMFTKWQDMQCVENCDSPDPADHVEFSQPVWQTAQMFLGECLCLLPGFYSFIMKHIRAFRNRRQGKTANGGYAPVSQTANGDGEGHQHGESNGNGNAGSRDVEGGGGGTEDEGEALEGTAPLLFFAPAACDICGTTLMNVGLLFTPVSIYQMTRGALVLWVGVFSVIFLRRHLYLFQWLSLVTVMLGVCIVGLSGTILKESAPAAASYLFNNSNLPSAFLPAAHPAAAVYNLPLSSEVSPIVNGGLTGIFGEHKKNGTGGGHGGKGGGGGGDEPIPEAIEALFGVFLILFAQLFTASQFVLEEKIMSKYDVEPLLAVGYEGLFGVITTLVAMPTLHFFYGSTLAGQGGYFDMRTGWNQMISSQPVLWSAAASAVSIALFNGCGLAVTRAISATARSTIDTCRTLGIWVASLLLGWEVLRPLSGSLQMLGFALLVYGTLVFNGIIRPPKFVRPNLRSRSGRSGSRARSRGRSRSGAPGSSSRGGGGGGEGGGGGGEGVSGNGEERRSRGRSRRSGKSKSKSASKSKRTAEQEGSGGAEQAAAGEGAQQAEGSNVKTGKLIDDSADGGGKGSHDGQQ